MSSIDQLVLEDFKGMVKADVALPVCAMSSLVKVINRSTAQTWMQLEFELRSAITLLKTCDTSNLGTSSSSISATLYIPSYMLYTLQEDEPI
jgi:hypothetical protein